MFPAAALFLRLLLLIPGAEQQTAAQTTAPPPTPPAEAQASQPQLPINFSKIKVALSAPSTLKLTDNNPFRFYSETVKPTPKFSDIVGDFDLFNGPVPHSGMTHQEFVQSTRPKDMYSSAGFTPGDVIRWGLLTYGEGKAFELIRKGLKELADARTEEERRKIRARIDRELAALRGETIK